MFNDDVSLSETLVDTKHVKSITAWYKKGGYNVVNYEISKGKNSDFDVVFTLEKDNLRFTKLHEVKEDFKCYRWANIAIEFECNGYPSGISSTKADYWNHSAHVRTEFGCCPLLMQMYTSQLKQFIAENVEYWRKRFRSPCIKKGGDGYRARLYIIPLELIMSSKIAIELEYFGKCTTSIKRHME